MKSLDFDTRSLIAKECINRVCEAAGLKTIDKKRRTDKRIARMLADSPSMEHAGVDVNLSITSAHLNLIVCESGDNLAKHEMPNISFASGGDTDTLDFAAYVAKDSRFGRACFVLECGGGRAQDVITTIGQAFELRFKEFLKRTPRLTERLETNHFNGSGITQNPSTTSIRSDDREYYNDLPGKIPPDIVSQSNGTKDCAKPIIPNVAPRKKNGFEQTSTTINLIDLNDSNTNNGHSHHGHLKPMMPNDPQYVNCMPAQQIHCSDDPFDIKQFTSNESTDDLQPKRLPPVGGSSSSPSMVDVEFVPNYALNTEEWFHGPISRKESELLVIRDGDFLVRESQVSSGQYVLTGMQSSCRKHLLLVDPEGVVRTKDKTFESVSHLINYHRNNGLPIISSESALILKNPIIAPKLPMLNNKH